MRRSQVEALLVNAASQGSDFHITVPYDEMPAVLNILKHLQASGQFEDYSRRDAESICVDCPEDQCGCINIYGYMG